jgi:hypothetical protein
LLWECADQVNFLPVFGLKQNLNLLQKIDPKQKSIKFKQYSKLSKNIKTNNKPISNSKCSYLYKPE